MLIFEKTKKGRKCVDIKKPEDINVFNIVTIPEDIEKMTANLQAPIIINRKNNRGKQIILDNPDYQIKHYILEEIKKASNTTNKVKKTIEDNPTEEAR